MTHPAVTDSDYLPLPGSPEPQRCYDCAAVQLIFADCLCVGCALALFLEEAAADEDPFFGLVAELSCYECGEPTAWLAPDSRCGRCTRLTPEEVTGEVQP